MAFNKKREEIVSEGSSIIERGIEIYGEKIVGSTNMFIRGIVVCPIEMDADLVLEEEGHIKGDINARNCVIKGEVNGNVYVSGHLHITSGGSIIGDITCGTLEISSGGKLIGACNKQVVPTAARPLRIAETEGYDEEIETEKDGYSDFLVVNKK